MKSFTVQVLSHTALTTSTYRRYATHPHLVDLIFHIEDGIRITLRDPSPTIAKGVLLSVMDETKSVTTCLLPIISSSTGNDRQPDQSVNLPVTTAVHHKAFQLTFGHPIAPPYRVRYHGRFGPPPLIRWSGCSQLEASAFLKSVFPVVSSAQGGEA